MIILNMLFFIADYPSIFLVLNRLLLHDGLPAAAKSPIKRNDLDQRLLSDDQLLFFNGHQLLLIVQYFKQISQPDR